MFLLPNNTNRVQYSEALIISPISRLLFLFKKNTLRNKIYRVSCYNYLLQNINKKEKQIYSTINE